MQDLNVFKVPAVYSWQLIKPSWSFTKKNYALIFTAAIIINAISLPGYLLKGTELIWGTIGTTLAPGLIILIAKLFENQKASLEDLFAFYNDSNVLKKAWPFLVFDLLIHIIFETLPLKLLPESPIALGAIGMGSKLFHAYIYLFLVPLLFLDKLEFWDSLKLSFKAAGKNWIFLLAFTVVITGVVILSLLVLVLPFIFFFVPMALPLTYFIYLSVFKNKSPKELEAAINPPSSSVLMSQPEFVPQE